MSFRRNLYSVIATFALSLSLLLLVQCSEMGSWDLFKVQRIFSAFEKRMKLTFLNSGQGEDLIDFPVLVILTPLRLDYSHVKADGSDILFMDGDASTRLDSSPFANHGIPQSFEGDESTSAYVGGGDDFDGTDDYITCTDHSSLRITGQVTLSAWFKLADGEYNGYVRLLTKKPRFDSTFGYGIWMHPNNEWVAVLAAADNQARADLVGDQLDSGWHHAMCTISGTVGRVYLDGVHETDDAVVDTLQTSGQDLRIARIDDTGSGPGDYFDGIIDEVRIENVARSADWAKAQYLTMTDAFIVYGPEESIR